MSPRYIFICNYYLLLLLRADFNVSVWSPNSRTPCPRQPNTNVENIEYLTTLPYCTCILQSYNPGVSFAFKDQLMHNRA